MSAHPERVPLNARFDATVRQFGDRVALAVGEQRLTYAELDELSRRVAGALMARDARADSVIGLHMSRGADLVIALVGVLRSGAAYVPLDPDYPHERLAFMMRDSGAELILTDGGPERVPVSAGVPALPARDLIAAPPVADPLPEFAISRLAYVIYTSGSTGRPKGVQVTHTSVAALLGTLEEGVFGPAGSGRVGWNASVCFDASVQQWLRLFRGDTVVLVDGPTRSDPEALIRLIVKEQLTDLDIVPSHLQLLVEYLEVAELEGPLRLLIGGERISEGLWKRLAALAGTGRVLPVNLYGPTECTVDVTAGLVSGEEPHIGKPLPGVGVYVLDEMLRPVALGEVGEIYIAGPGLARGYQGQPGATAERFVADVVTGDGGRMYRSGDRARLRADGTIDYIGRSDLQIKLRGYRIEIGEVEATIERCAGVAQAVVRLCRDLPDGVGLVAYCRCTHPVTPDSLRTALAIQLPDYMIPAAFVFVEQLPLTANGKVDREALPRPTIGTSDRPFTAPRTHMEKLIAGLWTELLGEAVISATDDFFDLGGQSVLAIQLAARLRRILGWAVPMTAVFENPRLCDFAAFLAEG